MTIDENGVPSKFPSITNTRNWLNPTGKDQSQPQLEAEDSMNTYAYLLLFLAALLIFIAGIKGGSEGMYFFTNTMRIDKDIYAKGLLSKARDQ